MSWLRKGQGGDGSWCDFLEALMSRSAMSCSPDAHGGTNRHLVEHRQPKAHLDARLTPL